MNRRDFVKALAGIPLLGLLVKVPERKEPYHEVDCLNFNGASHRVESALYEAAYAELQGGAEEQSPYGIDIDYDETEDWLVTSYKDENGEWHEQVLVGSPPADLHWDKESPLGTSYWNGHEWIAL